MAGRQRPSTASNCCAHCDEALIASARPVLLSRARFLIALTVLANMVGLLDSVLPPEWVWIDGRLSASGVGWSLANFLAFAAYAFWQTATNQALTSRGHDLENGPRAWLWNIVPVANLVMPYRVMREMYERAVVDVGFDLPLWWGLRIIGNVGLRFTALQEPGLLAWVFLLGALISDALFLRIVYRTTRGLSEPVKREDLAPVGHVEGERPFAEFL